MHRRSTGWLMMAVCSTFIAGWTAVAFAADAGCTNRSLRGDFGFTAQGTVTRGSTLPAPLQGPFASVGEASFDGAGHFTLTATASFNGLIQPVTTAGTYSVNRDCTYTSVADNGITFYAAIADGGNEIAILQTTPGVAIAGRARRLYDGPDGVCAHQIAGRTYGFTATGFAGPPTVPPQVAGPLTGAGIVAFSRDGSFSLTARRSVDGVIDPVPLVLPGTYTVAQDCGVQMSFDIGFTFTGVIVDRGLELLFVETDPGTALLVTAKKL